MIKHSRFVLVFVFILLTLQISPDLSFYAQSPETPQYVEGEILVRFRQGVNENSRASAHSAVNARPVRAFDILDTLELVRIPSGISVQEGIEIYRRHPAVLYAEPNFIVRLTDIPNDPFFEGQWGLHNTGQFGSTTDADIDAPEAWDITTGSSSVVVAVIDTGIDYNHEDLSENMARNTADCNNNGKDDDKNGHIDDCFGIDTVNKDSDPMDDHGHGTHVGGIIGAVGNNNIGVTGVNRRVGLLACKFVRADGTGDTAGAIACFDYVKKRKEQGVNVVATNNSWGGINYSQSLVDAIDAHRQLGILFVAAAGNGGADQFGDDNDLEPFYPCSFYVPNGICVSATDEADALTYFSNFGRHTVHIGAPGSGILATLPGNNYDMLSGTSMASPHVAGVAALLKAQNPSRDWRAIKNLILAGGDSISPLSTNTVSQRRLNAYGSLTCSNSVLRTRLKPIGTLVLSPVRTAIDLAVLHISCASPNGEVSVTVSPGGTIINLLDGGSGADKAAGDGIYSGRWTPTSKGVYTLTFPGGDVVTVNIDTPVISVSPTSIDFGGTNVGNTLERTIIVQNAGGGTLTGKATTSSPYSIFTGASYSLTSGNTQSVVVRFSPTSTGTFLGNVNFTGGGGASVPLTGKAAIPPTLLLSYEGRVKDRVGQGDVLVNPDGFVDGTFNVTVQAGSGNRIVTFLDLSKSGGRWDTVSPNANWILGAAASLVGPLHNSSNAAVNFPVADGGSFKMFCSDYNNSHFLPGTVFTLNAGFEDGSTAILSYTIPSPPPPPSLAISFEGKVRDRVGKGDTFVNPDGSLDGTFTVTMQPGSGNRIVTSLDLSRSGGRWDTIPGNANWALGASDSMDGPLHNSSNAMVGFPVADGSSFRIFASDHNNAHFAPGTVFTLTAGFGDGSTAVTSLTLPPPVPPPTLTLTFEGKIRDRVGQGDLLFNPDGLMDGTFTVTVQPGSGNRTVTFLEMNKSGGRWDTVSGNANWALGAADTLDGPLHNSPNATVSFPVSDGSSFKLFCSDFNNTHFLSGTVFNLTAGFGDGSTAIVSVTLPAQAPPTLTISYEGKVRDRVGQGDTSVNPDGFMDGAFTVTMQPGGGNRIVTSLDLSKSGGRWDTISGNTNWALGAADSLDAPLHNSSNAAVNFPVADGGSFKMFCSDYNNSHFLPGTAFTLTAGFGDGSTAIVSYTLPSSPPPISLTISFEGKVRDRVGKGDISVNPDGFMDGTFTVTLQPGSGNRTVTSLDLSNTGGRWDTVSGNANWALGAADSLDAPLHNSSNAAVNFPVADGGSFKIFGSDYNNTHFTPGTVFTVTAGFGDGSSGVASVTLTAAPPPTLTMSYEGKVRDRVGKGDTAVSADGFMDGTFTVTVEPGSGSRTVTRLVLTRSGSGVWDTVSPNSNWVLGAAASLDAALYNGSNAAVNFAISDGSSFKIFGSDYNNSLFISGSSFSLTVTLEDGSNATVNASVP